MGKRRAAREAALQVLFELEFKDAGAEEILARRRSEGRATEAVRDYSASLVRGIIARREEIDGLIQGSAKHWRLSRMALVDRNILRLAVFELLEERSLAPAIVIDEAIEIARKYSGEEATIFVNGVLDAVRKTIEGRVTQPEMETHGPTKKSAPKPSGRLGRSRGKK
jgi:N utilization substance protein B